ncbi:A1 cistron-splicing factor Aar2p [Trichomonascus vanleenenianus]|uniref:U5 snRNP complex subunit AAR2 n=1 Tax=Trichomonascus vanleenenianus TaxID=2268995 RepID=UPI003EC9B5E6
MSTTVSIVVPDGWLVGIDTHYFNTTPQFRGIKNVPPNEVEGGVHVVHWGRDAQNLRSAYFFVAALNETIRLKWDASSEAMQLDENGTSIDEREAMYMLNYPESDANKWMDLTDYITRSVLARILPPGMVDTATSSRKENKQLEDILEQKGQAISDSQKEPEFTFTEVDLKHTWPSHTSPAEVTKHSIDKSWYLTHVVLKRQSFDSLMGELQLAFLLVLLLANYSAGQQWITIIELLLGCDDYPGENRQNYSLFFEILENQLKACPEEYFESLLEIQRLSKAFSNFVAFGAGIPSTLTSALETVGVTIDPDIDEEGDELFEHDPSLNVLNV